MKRVLLLSSLFIASFVQGQITHVKDNIDIDSYTPVGTRGIFLGKDSLIWASDGTTTGTKKLSSTIKYKGSGAFLGNKLLFVGQDTAGGEELYVTNGTPTGTKLVKDLNPGGSSTPSEFVVMNGVAYFTADIPGKGRELCKTNGTAGGTLLVKDIVSGAAGSNNEGEYGLATNGTRLFFSAFKAGQGYELWVSDGTGAGTVQLKNIRAGSASSNPKFFNKLNGVMLFLANDGINGTELWKTNGTAAGTVLVKNIYPGAGNSMTNFSFFQYNNKAYFIANDSAHGEEPWVSDGTPGGTTLLKDIFTGTFSSYASLYSAVSFGSKFLFGAFSITNGFELWQSDGTPNGTSLFKDIVAGNGSSSPILLPAYKFDTATGTLTHPLYNGLLFFAASTPSTGIELWVTDGTSNGTHIVKDIYTGKKDGITNFSYIYTTTGLYFAAKDSAHGNEIWKTDGTAPNTVMVADIYPGLPSSDPQFAFEVANHVLLFTANDGSSPKRDLYRVNGVVIQLRPARVVPMDEAADWSMKVVGNPVRSQVNLTTTNLSNSAKLYITDMWGRVVVSGIKANSGTQNISVDNLSAGTYILVVENNGERKISKFIKQ